MRLPDGLHWNLLHLFTEAVEALRGRSLAGVGVDTWGVDYALLDEEYRVLGLPFHYRDSRTEGAPGVGGYEITGIQDMPINTVYQLLADDRMRRGARDRAGAGPARLLAERRAGQRAHERLDDRAAGRAHRRVGATS